MQEASIHKPLVSVIMATYNSDFLTIVKSVHSILDQTLTDIELLLIDDSTDARSIMTIDTFERKHPQVRVIRSHTRLGFVPALNEGLRQAKGQFIARMDADDIAELTRLEKEVAFLNAHPDIAVVGTAIQLIDKNDQIVSSRSYPLSQNEIRKEAIVRCPLAHPTVLMRRQIVDEGYLYDETFKRSEDYELWLRLMKHGFKLANLEEPLLKYRIVEQMAQKRNRYHFRYALKAKWKNFDWKHPLKSLSAIVFGTALYLMPPSILRYLYRSEKNHYIAK